MQAARVPFKDTYKHQTVSRACLCSTVIFHCNFTGTPLNSMHTQVNYIVNKLTIRVKQCFNLEETDPSKNMVYS